MALTNGVRIMGRIRQLDPQAKSGISTEKTKKEIRAKPINAPGTIFFNRMDSVIPLIKLPKAFIFILLLISNIKYFEIQSK